MAGGHGVAQDGVPKLGTSLRSRPLGTEQSLPASGVPVLASLAVRRAGAMPWGREHFLSAVTGRPPQVAEAVVMKPDDAGWLNVAV